MMTKFMKPISFGCMENISHFIYTKSWVYSNFFLLTSSSLWNCFQFQNMEFSLALWPRPKILEWSMTFSYTSNLSKICQVCFQIYLTFDHFHHTKWLSLISKGILYPSWIIAKSFNWSPSCPSLATLKFIPYIESRGPFSNAIHHAYPFYLFFGSLFLLNQRL